MAHPVTPDDVARIAAAAERAGVAALDLVLGACRLSLRWDGPAALPPPAPEPDMRPAPIRAPAAGVFRPLHPALPPGSAAPRPVSAGAVVAFLQVGACLRPVLAAAAGMPGPALVRDGDLVGYGTPLFGTSP